VEWDSVFLYSNNQLTNCWLFKVRRLICIYSISKSTKGVFNAQGAWRFPNTTPNTVIERELSSVAIFQHLCMEYTFHNVCMELTFHNSFVIIDIVPSAVIFLTELSCWPKGYSNKATLLLGWSHRSTFYDRHHNQVDRCKVPYIKWKWIFYFLRRCFLSSITAKTFTGLDCIYE